MDAPGPAAARSGADVCQILARLLVEIAERGRQAVAAMFMGSTTKQPQRVLQAFRQRHETLAAEDDMGGDCQVDYGFA